MTRTLKIHAYAAEEAGPRLLITGAVHGNEKCGTVAIRRFIDDMESGRVVLTKGRVTLVPIVNLWAYEKNQRFIDENLNRDLKPREAISHYEAKIGNIICPLLRDCDVLLDLHSFQAKGTPFIFTDTPKGDISADAEQSYARALGPRILLSGWLQAYQRHPKTQAVAHYSIGTTEYARQFGAIAVTLECGQHEDPAAPEVAYRAILNALRHLGMIEGQPDLGGEPVLQVTMEDIFFKEEEGAFTGPWQHLQPIKAGEVVARTLSGKTLCAPYDARIIMPRHECPMGEEWFYLGREG